MRAGLIINPFAGIGGTVALKGSDGADIVRQALQRGAQPLAQTRAGRALSDVAASGASFCTCAGDMGADVLEALGIEADIVYRQANDPSTAADTHAAVEAMCERGIDVLVFAGGDGTARNVLDALEVANQAETLPVIGIPAGCKIHSAVYAVSPAAAGEVLSAVFSGEPVKLRSAKVMDLDEDLFRQGVVKASAYGDLLIPDDQSNMQTIKQGGIDHETGALHEIADEIIDNMEDGQLYLVGSGSTTAMVMQQLGLDNTLLGIDAVLDRELIGSDLDERSILELVSEHPSRIIVTLIGGQGHLFGRGNQQFSARVLRAVGRENMDIVATGTKLRSLQGRPLRMDTGDDELDSSWQGAVQVITGYEQRTLYRIG